MSAPFFNLSQTKPLHSRLFSPLGTAGLIVLMLGGFFGSQVLGIYIAAKALLPQAIQWDLESLLLQGGQNGTVVSLSVIFSFIILTSLSFLVVGRKVASLRRLSQYFAFRPFSVTATIQGLVGLVLFIVSSEILSQVFDRTPMDFVDPLFASMDRQWLLIVVVVVIAPIYEELVFRGLLWSAISEQFSPRRGVIIASIITSLLFAMSHLQYGLFEMAAIFVLALLFCAARVMCQSIFLPMLLHIVNNAVAMILYMMMGSGV